METKPLMPEQFLHWYLYDRLQMFPTPDPETLGTWLEEFRTPEGFRNWLLQIVSRYRAIYHNYLQGNPGLAVRELEARKWYLYRESGKVSLMLVISGPVRRPEDNPRVSPGWDCTVQWFDVDGPFNDGKIMTLGAADRGNMMSKQIWPIFQ